MEGKQYHSNPYAKDHTAMAHGRLCAGGYRQKPFLHRGHYRIGIGRWKEPVTQTEDHQADNNEPKAGSIRQKNKKQQTDAS